MEETIFVLHPPFSAHTNYTTVEGMREHILYVLILVRDAGKLSLCGLGIGIDASGSAIKASTRYTITLRVAHVGRVASLPGQSVVGPRPGPGSFS